jgi:hypothetical protein
MFLIVIVTFVISILGLFIQVVSLQTARMAASQNALLQTMITWHNAALNLASATPPLDSANMPCQMTSTTAINGLPVCTRGGAQVLVSSVLTSTIYNVANYSFASAVFNSTSPLGKYVLTYVGSTDSSGNIILPLPLPGGTTIGYTFKDLQTQMGRALPVNLAHGAASTIGAQRYLSIVFKNNSGTSTTSSYTIPTNIPDGAIGLISSAQ